MFLFQGMMILVCFFGNGVVLLMVAGIGQSSSCFGTRRSPDWLSWTEASTQRDQLSLKMPVRDAAQEECFMGGKPWCSSGVSYGPRTGLTWGPGENTRCTFCNKLRPERAHHCRQCDMCVLRRDHHCALIGNCIGWRNHKYFMTLLFWVCVTCSVFLFTPDGPGSRALTGRGFVLSKPFPYFFMDMAVVWTFGLLIIASHTFVFALNAACVNRTWVEAQYVGENPYNQGSCIANLEAIFGPLSILAFLPTEPSRSGDGTTFPSKNLPLKGRA
eukprot:TRINITY_DN27437_c0_g1_i1.p1 TRINITY_DN27437_c0_g1~~TRINITY_DN27437_c0_g1_i1.p1  ORF type:complete len:272 (-),score=8.38 TRINITY_DN27437_c0_g1_i1:294-1109(-)